MKKAVYESPKSIMYEVYSPEQPEENPPMIVYLYGAGERGRATEHLSRHGIPLLIEQEGREIPAIVLCPQCPANCVWDNIPFDIKEIIDATAKEYDVDIHRISLTGGSMGGFGTWAIGQAFPSFFSALAPIASGGAAWRCRNLVTTPVSAYHGELDSEVSVECAKMLVDATNRFGGSATLTVLPGLGHNDGINSAYRDCGVTDWLLSQRRTDFAPIPEAFSKYF